MNMEVYSYTVYTTVLGMLVVFLSLSVLSLMMVVLKRIFTGEGNRSAAQRKPKGKIGKPETGEDLDSSDPMPFWVLIALAAYLDGEQEPDRPTADPWNAVVNHYDPWIAGGRADKRGA